MRLATLALTTSGLISLAPLLCVSAHAQDTDDQVETNDVITVMARKREEAIQDVPASVSVLDSEAVELLALDGIADYLRQLPNAILINAGPEYLSDISIRGQGGGRQGFSETATGIYRNGVYAAGGGFGGRSFSRMDFFDIENVQVYRGPQGALYGRNAVGGAVNVVSKAPSREKSAEFEASYRSAERYDVSGIFNTPISDSTAARVGVFYIDQNDGFVTDQNTGEAVDQAEHFGVRGSVLTEFTPSTTAKLLVEYYDGTTPGFSALGRRLSGVMVAGQVGDADAGPFEANDSRIGFVEIETVSAYAEVASELAIGELTGIVSFAHRDAGRFNEDLDSFIGFQGVDLGGIITDLTVDQTEDYHRWVGEVRLASNPGAPFSWLIGADVLSSEDDVATINGGTSGLGGLATTATRRDLFVEKLNSISAFGLVEFAVSPTSSVTLEARIQSDEKDFMYTREQRGAIILDTGDINQRWTRFLPAATIDFDVADEQIVYVRASTGYRPGGFNTGVDASNEQFIPFDPETAYSIEAGWKGEFASSIRFGINAFYVRTDEIQAVSTFNDETSSLVGGGLQNVGDTDIYGIEAELGGVSSVGPGSLRWSMSAATTQGQFAEGSEISLAAGGMVEVVDLSGARVNRTRDYVAQANVFYNGPLVGTKRWFVGGSVQAEGGGFENATGDTSSTSGRELDDFLLFDARLGIQGKRWQLSAFGQNITDRLFRLQTVGNNEFYNQPSNYGLELRLTLGE